MPKSPLRRFDHFSVERLINEEVDMVYDRNHYMTKAGRFSGIWHEEKSRIYIYPGITEKKVEDVTIVHEWLHAYEDIILERTFQEAQIEWWAHFHLRRDHMFADYIRSFFPDFKIK